MRFFIYGLLLALVLFLVSGGHLLFLPLFFVLPLGGLVGHRQGHGSYWSRSGSRGEPPDVNRHPARNGPAYVTPRS